MKGFVLCLRVMSHAHHKKSQKILLQICNRYAKQFYDKNARIFNNGLMKGMHLRLHCKDLSDVQWKFNDLNDIVFEVLEKNLGDEVESSKIQMPDIRVKLIKNNSFKED